MYNILFGVIICYLIGSIPCGYIIGKLVKKTDIREHGSGNTGATNVFRVLGKFWGIVTLVLDILKGLICVTFILSIFNDGIISIEAVKIIFGFAAVLGHVYSVFLKFSGGIGVATGAGVFLGICPLATLIVIVVFSIILTITRYVSLSSIISAIILPVCVYFIYNSKVYLIISLVMSVIVVRRHKENIRRLILGTENKIGTNIK